MTKPSDSHLQRLKELLAGRVLGDLTPDEELELSSAELSGDLRRLESELEATAAAIHLALIERQAEIETPSTAGMPTQLRDRIRAQAVQVLPRSQRDEASSLSTSSRSESVANGLAWREAFAWLVCAASLIFAVSVYSQRIATPRSAAVARASLLKASGDQLTVDWSAGKHPFAEQVVGDVVWSGARQEGFMRFVGMPVNDPAVEQYQLWIIDPSRDDEPIDGGVFDITANGETIVPIHAKLTVNQPTAFAITIEKPGGVVVSTQERLPLLAVVSK